MKLLAEWGKPYQVTSEVGYGVMTDKTRCAVHVHISYMAMAIRSSLCVTAKVTQQFTPVIKLVVRPAGQQDTRK
jgi:Zn-dependent membrane protease YugP